MKEKKSNCVNHSLDKEKKPREVRKSHCMLHIVYKKRDFSVAVQSRPY